MQNYQNRDGPPAQGFNGPPPPPGQNQMPPHHGQGNMPPSPPPPGQPNYQPQMPNTEAGYYQQGGAPGIKVVTKVTKGTQGRPTKVAHLATEEATPTHRHTRVVAILASLVAAEATKVNEATQLPMSMTTSA